MNTIEVVLSNVAQIGDKNYCTLEDAVADIPYGHSATIKLLKDSKNWDFLDVLNIDGRDVTIDMRGYTLKARLDVYGTGDSRLTLKNGTLDISQREGDMDFPALYISSGAALTVDEDVTMTTDDRAWNIESTSGENTVTINGALKGRLELSEVKESNLTVNVGGTVQNGVFVGNKAEKATINITGTVKGSNYVVFMYNDTPSGARMITTSASPATMTSGLSSNPSAWPSARNPRAMRP